MSKSPHGYPYLGDPRNTHRSLANSLRAMRLRTHLRDVQVGKLGFNDQIYFDGDFFRNKRFTNNRSFWCGVSEGSADDYEITPADGRRIVELLDGDRFMFEVHASNTTSTVLRAMDVESKTVRKEVGAQLVADDFVAGRIVEVMYDKENDRFKVTSAGEPVSEASVHQHMALYRMWVHLSTNQALNNASTTTMLFNTENYDDDNTYAAGTGKYTVPVSGVYLFQANLQYGTNATSDQGIRLCRIKNVTTGRIFSQHTSSGNFSGVGEESVTSECSCIVEAAASDEIIVEGFQDSGNALNVLGSSLRSSAFQACCLRVGL